MTYQPLRLVAPWVGGRVGWVGLGRVGGWVGWVGWVEENEAV